MPNTLRTLEIRKAEIEDWFSWHPDSPNAAEMREEYRKTVKEIEKIKNETACKTTQNQ